MSENAIHVDVCPDCNTPTTFHGLDAPGHCPHGWDRRVPVEYVPAEQLEAWNRAYWCWVNTGDAGDMARLAGEDPWDRHPDRPRGQS